MRSDSYAEFRKPIDWVDGESGQACISYKGHPEYSYDGKKKLTKDLYELKAEQTYSYKLETWDDSELEMNIRKDKDEGYIFTINNNSCSFKNFGKDLDKAVNRKYYNDEIRIVMVNGYYNHPKNYRDPDTKILTVFLNEEYYVQVMTYYYATEEMPYIEDYNEKDFYFKFQNGWENLRKIKFNQRTTWQLCIPYYKKGSNYVNPKKVSFEGRCQCEKCIKDLAFQNADQTKKEEMIKIHMLLQNLNEKLDPKSNALIIMEIPNKYIRLVKIHLNEDFHLAIGRFSQCKDKATIWVCEPHTYGLLPMPKFCDQLPYHITVFSLELDKINFNFYEGHSLREYLDKQNQEYLSQKGNETCVDYIKQFASVIERDGKWVLKYERASRIL